MRRQGRISARACLFLIGLPVTWTVCAGITLSDDSRFRGAALQPNERVAQSNLGIGRLGTGCGHRTATSAPKRHQQKEHRGSQQRRAAGALHEHHRIAA
jgi:hypothetical protein